MKKQNIFLFGVSAFMLLATFSTSFFHSSGIEPDNVTYDEDKIAYLNHPAYADEEEEETIAVSKVILHYHNDDGKCGSDTTTGGTNGGRSFYIWVNGVAGIECFPDKVANAGQDMELTVDFSTEKFSKYGGKSSLLFIIKYRQETGNENWGGQSSDTELVYKDHLPDENGVVEVWTTNAVGSDVAIYNTEAETKVDGLKIAEFVDWKTIRCKNTATAGFSYALYAFDETFYKIDAKERDEYRARYKVKEGTGGGAASFDIVLPHTAHINMVYMVESLDNASTTGLKKNTYVTYDKLYDDARFNQYYTYDGDNLGFNYNSRRTVFRVWAPTAGNMTVKLYKTGTTKDFGGSNIARSYHMNYTGHGLWSLTISGDLKGMYYTYLVDNSSGSAEVCDPYATSTGLNGLRGYIYSKEETNPEGWDALPLKWDGEDKYDITTPQQLSVYEVHVQDLTSDATWTGQSKKGTYDAFVEKGTTYTLGEKTVKTGYDHLKELGVNAVQLQPAFDHDNDESDPESYNWGYNPLNYNVPEGLYSSDPTDGAARVKEFKNMVLELSKTPSEGDVPTRVIMDVVYNHVSRASGSNFTKLMPKYFFRYTEDGEYYNGSGCANEIKTEAPMMSKFIVDSLKMWATDYKVKGFRFDLMGLIDFKTIKKAAQELYKIDPDIYLYGEGWTGDGSDAHIQNADGQPYAGNWGSNTWTVYNKLGKDGDMCYVGAFNDSGRNAIRGGNDTYGGSKLPTWGYMQQGPSDASTGNRDKVASMLWGINQDQENGNHPEQTVNYASCHDNWTLYDQLYYTLGNTVTAPSNLQFVYDASMVTHAYIMMGNACAFIHGGEELFRSKELNETERAAVTESTYENMYGHYISHNSYNVPASVNAFDWSRKIKIGNIDTSHYAACFAGAIKLHASLPKYAYKNPFPYDMTSAGNGILGISWSGSEKGSSSPQTYNGCCGFQLDEYFVFLAGRQWGWVQFGDVPKSTKVWEFGPNEFDNANGTVNLGNFDADTGATIVVYKRGN